MKKRLDYYILIIIIGGLIIWLQFTFFNIYKFNVDSLKLSTDSLKIETSILKQYIKKDTIIININLKQNKNGN